MRRISATTGPRSRLLDVDDLADDLAIVPTLPDSENVRLDSVELWSDSAADFEATTAYTVRPNNTIRLHSPGTCRITANVSSPAAVPDEVTEGIARVWAIPRDAAAGRSGNGRRRWASLESSRRCAALRSGRSVATPETGNAVTELQTNHLSGWRLARDQESGRRAHKGDHADSRDGLRAGRIGHGGYLP